MFFLPYTDEKSEGFFLDIYDGKPLAQDLFFPGQPNGLGFENCAFAYVHQNGLYDQPCKEIKNIRNCVCQFEQEPILTLRGLCKSSFLDTYYVIKNNKKNSLQPKAGHKQ